MKRSEKVSLADFSARSLVRGARQRRAYIYVIALIRDQRDSSSTREREREIGI